MNYQFPSSKVEFLKHLYEVDEEYYRYVFQLDDDFIPEFKMSESTSKNWIGEKKY